MANRGGWPSLHASPRETTKPCGMLSAETEGGQGGITNEGHGWVRKRTKKLERRNRKGNGTRQEGGGGQSATASWWFVRVRVMERETQRGGFGGWIG